MFVVPEIVPLGDCKAFIPIEPSGGNIGTPLEYLAVDTPPEALDWRLAKDSYAVFPPVPAITLNAPVRNDD